MMIFYAWEGSCRVRVDGPLARGFLRFLSLTAFQAEGGGIALSGDEYKVSVTGLAFCVIWHDWHSGDWLTAFASPFPATRDFPLCRGQNKTPRDNLLINPPLEMTKEPCHPTVMLKRKARLAPESLAVRMQKKRSPSFRGASFYLRSD